MKSRMVLLITLTVAPTLYAQWDQQVTPVTWSLHDVAFSTSRQGFAVGDNGVILRTTNGGGNWTLSTSPTTSILTEAVFLDSLRGWIAGAPDDWGDAVYSTIDGGNNWTWNYDYRPYGVTYYFGLSVRQTTNGVRTWIVGGRDANMLSYVAMTDGSGTWYPQNIGFAGRLVGVDFISDKLGWAAGERGLILHTTNGGTWWNQQPCPTDTGFNSVRFFNSDIGLVVGAWGKILKTTNGGEEWRIIPYTGNEVLFKIWIRNDSVAYAVGSNSTILQTRNKGETWARQTVNASPTTFEDILFVSDTEGWAVGANGVIVHTTNAGGVTAAGQSELGIPSQQKLYAIYPNPFNPTTSIKYDVASQAHVVINVYNVLGQVVSTLVDEVKSPGRYTTTWNARDSASGTYWCRMTIDGSSEIQKMILLK